MLSSANAESPVAGFSFQSLMSGVGDLLHRLSLLSECITCKNRLSLVKGIVYQLPTN